MATSYDAFMSRVLPDVPGCAEIVATQAIRDAVIQFCADSQVYQVDLDPVTTIVNERVYDLEPPTLTSIAAIMEVRYIGRKLVPVPLDVVDPTVEGPPRGFTQIDSDTFILTPIPDRTENGSVTLRVALCPTRASTTCEDFLYEDWVEEIVHGALERLQGVPGKAYSNLPLALWHGKQFAAGIAAAQASANKGFGRADLRVQMRPWA